MNRQRIYYCKQRRDIQRLAARLADLLLSIYLMLIEEIGMEVHVSRLINTMNVSESSSDAEIGPDCAESLVNVKNVFRLSVQAGVVNSGVVDAVFLTTGDTNLHLEPETNGYHALEIFHASGDVFFFRLFGEIEHVGRKEGFLVLLVVGFVCLEHSVEPRKKFLGTVVAVQNDGTAKKKRFQVEIKVPIKFITYTP